MGAQAGGQQLGAQRWQLQQAQRWAGRTLWQQRGGAQQRLLQAWSTMLLLAWRWRLLCAEEQLLHQSQQQA